MRGAVLPTCGERRFLNPNETRRRRPAMAILLNQIRLLAFIVFFCVGWLDAAVGGPAEALSAVKKTVLALRGYRLSIPAVKTREQVLTAGLSAWAAGRSGNFLGIPRSHSFLGGSIWGRSRALSPREIGGAKAKRSFCGRWLLRWSAGTRVCTSRRTVSRRANCLYECELSSGREEGNATGCHLTLDGLNV